MVAGVMGNLPRLAAASLTLLPVAAATSPVATGSNGLCDIARGYCYCDRAHAGGRCDGGSRETPVADATPMVGANIAKLDQTV